MNSRIILFTGFAIAIISILIVALVLFSGRNGSGSEQDQIDNSSPNPTLEPIPTTPPYDKSATDKLIDTVETRPTMQPEDTGARERLLNLLNNETGNLYTSETVRIGYVKAPDVFQGEIKTLEVETGKEEVISFFKEQGFSEQGICNLPLMFYLSADILSEYKASGKTFVSIPDFCL